MSPRPSRARYVSSTHVATAFVTLPPLTPSQPTNQPTNQMQGAELLPASPVARARMRLLGEMWQASGVGNYWPLLQVSEWVA